MYGRYIYIYIYLKYTYICLCTLDNKPLTQATHKKDSLIDCIYVSYIHIYRKYQNFNNVSFCIVLILIFVFDSLSL